MKTKILRLNGSPQDDAKIRAAARALRDGKLVAFPTETVYGVGANADDPAAMRRLSEVKKRSRAKPYAMMIPDERHVERYVGRVPELAHKLMRMFWPGPLTIVVRVKDGRTVGLRLPDHPVARALVAWADCPVAAPSANPSGSQPSVTVEGVLQQLGGKIDVVVDGGRSYQGLASSVVLVKDEDIEILREGPITQKELMAARDYTVLFVCSANSCRSPMAEALLRQAIEQRRSPLPRGRQGRSYNIFSAGTGVLSEGPVNPLAQKVIAELGPDISSHRSRPLSMSMISAADLIYVMTDRERQSILEMLPETVQRVFCLNSDGDILDPAGSNENVFRECRDLIATLIEKVAVKL